MKIRFTFTTKIAMAALLMMLAFRFAAVTTGSAACVRGYQWMFVIFAVTAFLSILRHMILYTVACIDFMNHLHDKR